MAAVAALLALVLLGRGLESDFCSSEGNGWLVGLGGEMLELVWPGDFSSFFFDRFALRLIYSYCSIFSIAKKLGL